MSDSDGASAPEKHRGLKEPWKPGQSGNPAGRKPGSRNKLQECFLADLHDDYREHGRAAIVEVRENKPEVHLHAIVRLIPRQVEKIDSQLSDLTDDELDQLTRYLEVIRAEEGRDSSQKETVGNLQ